MQLVISARMLTPFVPPDAIARISLRDRICEVRPPSSIFPKDL
jgi:hypothetical protein